MSSFFGENCLNTNCPAGMRGHVFLRNAKTPKPNPFKFQQNTPQAPEHWGSPPWKLEKSWFSVRSSRCYFGKIIQELFLERNMEGNIISVAFFWVVFHKLLLRLFAGETRVSLSQRTIVMTVSTLENEHGTQMCRFGSDDVPFQLGDSLGSSR